MDPDQSSDSTVKHKTRHRLGPEVNGWLKTVPFAWRVGSKDQDPGVRDAPIQQFTASAAEKSVKDRPVSPRVSKEWILAEDSKWQEEMLLGVGGWIDMEESRGV